MDSEPLYHEKIDSRIIIYLAAFLGLISLGMLGLVIYHFGVAPIDNEPGLGWFFLAESLVMGTVSFLVYQFRRLEIILTYQGIVIKFNRIRKFISWIDIESYKSVTTSKFLNSGGWKFGLGKHGWYVMYTVIGKPRISLKLNAGRIRELLFSTANPQEVSRIIKKQTGKEEIEEMESGRGFHGN
jgi:hypothetical protein